MALKMNSVFLRHWLLHNLKKKKFETNFMINIKYYKKLGFFFFHIKFLKIFYKSMLLRYVLYFLL